MAQLCTPQGHSLPLPEGGISVGAALDNEVPVAAHLGLAPVHFRLQPWEGGHFIEDAGSGLGTLVNGHPIHWKPLIHGDIITAGELEVVYTQQTIPVAGKAPIAVAPPAPPVTPAPPVPIFAASPAIPSPVSPATPEPAPPQPAAPSWEPAAATTPPAWLPADLLPEGYRMSLPEKSAGPVEVPRPAPAPEAGPAWLPSQPRRKTKRRLLPVAAVLAVLGGAAFLAWQQGILPPFLKQADGLGNPPTSELAAQPPSLPSQAPPPAPKPNPELLATPAKTSPPAPAPMVLPPAPAAPQVVAAPPGAVRLDNPPPALPPVEIRAAIPVRK